MRETSSSASRVAQLVTLIEAKYQSTHCMCICSRGHDPGDDQFLTIRAFGLDPVMNAPRTIWRISNLRHDALQAHFAGVPKQCCARSGERFTQAEWSTSGLAFKQSRESTFARHQRQWLQIHTIEIHEIKCVERHPIVP